MNTSNPVADEAPKKVWKFDGTIPAWGLFLILFSLCTGGMTYTVTSLQDLKDRMLTREVSAAQYRDKVDQLQKKVDGFDTLRQDVGTLKELMIRVERKLDSFAK